MREHSGISTMCNKHWEDVKVAPMLAKICFSTCCKANHISSNIIYFKLVIIFPSTGYKIMYV